MAKNKFYKCNICKGQIDIVNEDPDSFFYEIKNNTKKYYHCDCYIEHEQNKIRCKKTSDESREYIEQCRKKEVEKNIRHQLFDYVLDMYDISYAPKYFYMKFSQVFNGEYKGLNRPVPPEDLLDMWKQKREFLLKNAEKQRKIDKNISGISRVWYDLAILLGRYDGYLAWKEQKKQALVDLEQKKKESVDFVGYKDLAKNTTVKKENNAIDINAMLDEI